MILIIIALIIINEIHQNSLKKIILNTITGTLVIVYLVVAFVCLHISIITPAPQKWFTNLPANEKVIMQDYFKKNKFGLMSVNEYNNIEANYHTIKENEEKHANKIKNEKKYQGKIRNAQLKLLN